MYCRPLLLRSRPLLLLALAGLSGCGWRGEPVPRSGPQRLTHEVRQILARDEPSARFYRDRGRLESMGAELDAVLVALLNNPRADGTVRANALLLLADRRSSAALPVLRRVLVSSNDEVLRANAVFGLQKLAGDLPEAASAIRAAISDPSRRVRLSVLQALDVEDVPLMRALLARERDGQVRAVARELVSLAESRGAPLPRQDDGTYRTTGTVWQSHVVFQPVWRDTVAGVDVGGLWVEMPRARLVPLAQDVEVVAGVVPAFFSKDRTWVVYEAEREIRLRNLKTGETRRVGPGIAPRLIPFTDAFVYLEEQPDARRPRGREGTELVYQVVRAGFGKEAPEPLGELRAVARAEMHANASPVRWMVVGETPEGFVLRGEGVDPFLLPNPFPGSPPARAHSRPRPYR